MGAARLKRPDKLGNRVGFDMPRHEENMHLTGCSTSIVEDQDYASSMELLGLLRMARTS